MRNYAIVGFIYNQPCPVKCNFCCHTKEVVGEGRLNPTNTTPVIIDFSRDPRVLRFAFSGGDPFLYHGEILQIMQTCRSEGVTQPFHMVTSGYWAKTPEATEEKLKPLRSLGMDNLCVSYDYQHGETVPKGNILNIIENCANNGLDLEIYGIFWNQNEKLEDLLPGVSGVKLSSSLAMPIGAAKKFFTEKARYNLPDSAKYTCGKPGIYDLAIYPNGEAYPCCSGGFNKEASLECGNVFAQSAKSILDNVLSNFSARIAKEIQFDVLYERVKREDPALYKKLPEFGSVDSVCQICKIIFGNPEIKHALGPTLERMEIEYISDRFETDSLIISNQLSLAKI